MTPRYPALLLAAAASIGAAPVATRFESPARAAEPERMSATAKLPGFAAALSRLPTIAGPEAWRPSSRDDAWATLARARPGTRQAVRWNYAKSLIAIGRGHEAGGVLDVMVQDDMDLALVPAWRLARGAALAGAGRPREALGALGGGALDANPEACLWRMLAMSEMGYAVQALGQLGCAQRALDARPRAGRSRFVLAASRAAIGAGRPALALKWLGGMSSRDPAADLYSGKAYLALGQAQAARPCFERVVSNGTAKQRMDARLSLIEAASGKAGPLPADRARELDGVRLAWRGGDIEERALRLAWRLATDADDTHRALAAGATLFRHFDLGAETAPMLAAMQARLGGALDPRSRMPIDQAAGLYWDYRDLAPAGIEGDLLVGRFADRLQSAGLYGRAAELLHHQLTTRVRDIAQGPLSVKVASLQILAGHPDRALAALRATDGIAYPDDMLADRRRVAAAALHLSGRTVEAFAVLQDVPDGAAIRAEIQWKTRDWNGLAEAGSFLPGGGALGEVEQATVLRHAIALAMLGRESELAALRLRYGASFAETESASAFDVLTRAIGSIDPGAVAQAMAALPSASPAGGIADLLDAEVAVRRKG